MIRYGNLDDLDAISAVERACFPILEAASKDEFKKRLMHFPSHFYLMFLEDKLVSFVDGFVTDECDLLDYMYDRADLHNEYGKWQMIFGVNTLPEYRGKGYATTLLKKLIEDAKAQNRLGIVLTCKEEKITFYERLGFVNEGVADSSHGGAKWYQMRLVF